MPAGIFTCSDITNRAIYFFDVLTLGWIRKGYSLLWKDRVDLNLIFLAGECLKNTFCKMYIIICERFCPNEGSVVGYNWMKAKYTANQGVQIVEIIFQTRSKAN